MKKNKHQNKQSLNLSSSGEKPSAGARIKTEKKFGLKKWNIILCKNCGNAITSPETIISVNDKHIHTLTNLEDITFDIGCFSSANGSTIFGDSSPEFTWFKGFTWNLSICSNCLIHLGWYYQRKNETFFGLIVDRLMDTKSP